jgi:hypothetical protein
LSVAVPGAATGVALNLSRARRQSGRRRSFGARATAPPTIRRSDIRPMAATADAITPRSTRLAGLLLPPIGLAARYTSAVSPMAAAVNPGADIR